jgi:hypothetical protein
MRVDRALDGNNRLGNMSQREGRSWKEFEEELWEDIKTAESLGYQITHLEWKYKKKKKWRLLPVLTGAIFRVCL